MRLEGLGPLPLAWYADASKGNGTLPLARYSNVSHFSRAIFNRGAHY